MKLCDAIELVQSELYLEANMGYKPSLLEAWKTIKRVLGAKQND